MLGHYRAARDHFPRSGYGGVAEATVFPLAAGADGIPLIVALFHPVNELIGVPKTSHPVMAIDTAVKFRFIDIGAGVPT